MNPNPAPCTLHPEPMPVDQGTSLLTVLLLMVLLSAIALGVAAVVRVETLIAGQQRQAAEACAAAEAGLEVVVSELRALAEWTPLVRGLSQSSLSQGGFSGSKPVPGGGTVLVCCGAGSAADRLSIDTSLSPLPARRAVRWRPFLWTTMDALAPRDSPSRLFLIVWVANDEADRTGGPETDTNSTVLVRSEAIEPTGVRRIVEAIVGRPLTASGLHSGRTLSDEERRMRVGILRWQEVR
jgi:Tfp pilus assembly protein PilV